MQIKAPRGTADILPPASKTWQRVERCMQETAELFAYQELRFPIFEHTELFERGVGETTDIVSKEMYTFADKGQRSITLRPEGTASCVRALVEHGVYGGALPVKWYYSGPMFRYDRPAAGRFRQFHQFGAEVFGSHEPAVDAEVIHLMVEILQRLGLSQYELHLNSVGCPVCRQQFRQALLAFLAPVQEELCQDCSARYTRNPLRVLDCKVPRCQAAISGHPHMLDSLCPGCRDHYHQVIAILERHGTPYVQDHQLVRGLDYYTNTTFEIHLPGLGGASAVGGGGRYNGLVKELGGPELPGIGFAMGMERLIGALESKASCIHQWGGPVFLALFDRRYELEADVLLAELRRSGIKAERDLNGRSPKAQMKYAGKLNAPLVLIIGESEMEGGYYTIKDMSSGEQSQAPAGQIAIACRRMLDLIQEASE